MPAQDRYHEIMVEALTAEGWKITDDPFRLKYGNRNLWVDLGAEYETLAAEKAGRKIAIEIKSFSRQSEVEDLEKAIGQYNLYRDILSETEPDRELYLAIPFRTFSGIFDEKLGQLVLRRQRLNLIVFDEQKGSIHQWIPETLKK